jgi:hypothetical protein
MIYLNLLPKITQNTEGVHNLRMLDYQTDSQAFFLSNN